MISALRSKAAKVVTYFFVTLLIMGFVLWGVGDVLPTGGYANNVAASVGDVQISSEDVNQRYRNQVNRLRQLGLPIDPARAKALGLANSIVNDIINTSLFNQGANKLGLIVTDAHVRHEIRKDKSFHNQIGEFDRNHFNNVLRNNGFSEGSYISQLRQTVVRNQLLESLQTAAPVSKTLKDKIYNYRGEKRLATYIRINDNLSKKISEPPESDLKTFYKENAALFTAPEYRALTIAVLHANNLAKEIGVTDKVIKDYYESHIDSFTKLEKRSVKQMLFSSEKKAADAYTMLETGRTFANVAKEAAKMSVRATDLGTVTEPQLSRDLSPTAAAAVFKLETGKVSKPVQSLLGWHIIKIDSIEKGRKKQLSEVKEQIQKSVAKEKAIDVLYKLGTKVEDAVAGGATLEEASNRLNFKLRKISAVDRRGLDASGIQIKDLPKEGNILNVAFTATEGQDSPLTEAGTDGYFIIRVDKVTKPALRPLTIVRADAIKAWKAKKRREAAKKQAQGIFDQLKLGTSLGKLAEKSSLSLKRTEPFDRTGRGLKDRLPPALVEKLFTTLPGDSAMARGTNAYVVAQLKDIKPVESTAGKEDAKELTENLKQAIGNDILNQLANGLRKEHKVTINQQAIDQLYN